MARLTESYLRNMIKQAINEMYYDSGYGLESDYKYGLESGAGEISGKSDIRDLEEMADELGIPVGSLESVALSFGHEIQTHGGRKVIVVK